MTRRMYGGTPGDYYADVNGIPVPFVSGTVWSAVTGGSQVTDLQDVTGAPTQYATADMFGGFRFYGPDHYTKPLWVQAPGGSLRYKTEPIDGQVIFLGTAGGCRIWGGTTFPTAGDGAQDGDYLFYEG